MGGKSGDNTTTTTSQPNPAFLEAYKNIFTRASNVANTPYESYGGKRVADLSPDQLAGIQGVRDSQGIATPYINSAAGYYDKANAPLTPELAPFTDAAKGYFNASGSTDLQGAVSPWQTSAAGSFAAGSAPVTPMAFSPEAVSKYASPYTESVVNATQNQFNNTNAQQQNDLTGNLISKGAWGGDRAGIAKAVLAGQQTAAQAPVIAGLYDKGYTNALDEFNKQQGAGLTADTASRDFALRGGQGYTGLGTQTLTAGTSEGALKQGAGTGIAGLGGQWLGANRDEAGISLASGAGMAGLGTEALNTSLTGANALMSAGNTEQGQGQKLLDVPYSDWKEKNAYPFQVTNWLSGIGTGLGTSSGGTSSTTAPAPSTASTIGGLATGALGVAGATGAFGSSGWLSSLFSKRGGAVPDEPRGIVIPFPGHRARRASGGPVSPMVEMTPSAYAGGIAVPMLRTGTGGNSSTQAYLDSQVPGWTPTAPISYNFPLVDFNAQPASGGGTGSVTEPAGGGATDGGERNFGGAGSNDGYNGKVDTFGQLAKAAAGGITGNLARILYAAIFNPPLAPPPTPIALPSAGTDGGLSSGQIEINPTNAGGFGLGDLAGTTGDVATINGQLGSITGAPSNTLSGGLAAAPAPFTAPPVATAPLPVATYAPAPAADPNAGGGLESGNIEINQGNAGGFGAGDLAGMMETGLNGGLGGSMGDITGGGDRMGGGFEGGGGGGGGGEHEAGHEGGQAEGNNFEGSNFEGGMGARRGGRLHRDMGGFLPRTPWEDLDPGLVNGDTPDFADPIEMAPPDIGDDSGWTDASGEQPAGGLAGDPRGEAPWQMPGGGIAGMPAPPPVARRGAPGGGGGMGIPPPPPVAPGAPPQTGLAAGTHEGVHAAADDAPLKTDPWLSVIKAGAAMMSGRSPNALANLGTGITAGLDDFTQRKVATERAEDRRDAIKVRREQVAAQREWRTMSAQQAAQKLAAQIDHQNRQLGISGGHLGETQRHNQAMEEQAGRPTSLGTDQDGNLIIADKSGVRVTQIKPGPKPMSEYQQGQLQARQDTLALARQRLGRALTNDEEKRVKGMSDAALRVYTTNLQLGNKTTPEDAEKQASAIRGAVTARNAPPGGAQAPAGEVVPPKVGEVREGYRYKGGDPSKRESWVQE